MKRSEMLEKMVFSMELHAGNDPDWLDQVPGLKARALNYADKILRDLEEEGMLPPPSSFNIHNVDKQLGFVAEVTYDFPINADNSVNLWEPEDEEK